MKASSGEANIAARPSDDGILVFVRLTPRSSRDQVIGLEKSAQGNFHIAVRVRAVPEKGAANAALIKLFAKWLGMAKSEITLRSGPASRLKTLHLRGDPQPLLAALREKLGKLAAG